MKVSDISSELFETVEGPRQLIVHDHARRFALVDVAGNGRGFALSWRSVSIEPVVAQAPDGGKVWIGVDQRLAAVEPSTERVGISLALNSNLLQIVLQSGLAVALTETEAIVFNQDYSIRFIKGLPDLPQGASVEGRRVTITMVDGGEATLDLDTASLEP